MVGADVVVNGERRNKDGDRFSGVPSEWMAPTLQKGKVKLGEVK